jgi:hypothetical protein
MKQLKLLSLVFAIVFVSLSAWAASMDGKSELRIDGALQNVSTDNGDTRSITAQIVYNKFLSDQFSLGVAFRPTMQEREPDEGDSETMAQMFFLGRGDYYLAAGDSPFVPYAGAHAGFIHYTWDSGGNDDSETVLTYGLQGGGKYFVGENTSLNLELDLSMYEMDSGDDSSDVTVISFLVGYSFYF